VVQDDDEEADNALLMKEKSERSPYDSPYTRYTHPYTPFSQLCL
jgi:hypothetical protein